MTYDQWKTTDTLDTETPLPHGGMCNCEDCMYGRGEVCATCGSLVESCPHGIRVDEDAVFENHRDMSEPDFERDYDE